MSEDPESVSIARGSVYRWFSSPPGGLVLFGLLSIIMDIFKIASYVGYLHCDSAVKVAFPVVQLIFIVVQVRKTYYTMIYSPITK